METFLLLAPMAALLPLFLLNIFEQPSAWKIGDRALVQWSGDGHWYAATVTAAQGGQYYVIFDDGDEEWTTEARMAAENLSVGDKILGNWKRSGTYYPGIIAGRVGNVIAIQYDDGDQETVTIARIKVVR